MMVYISPIGRNWGPIVNWDALGKLYASIAISWTVILALGSIWIVRNRRLPFLRIRNIPLAIASVCFLHVYLVKILLAYTTNGHFLCSAEFWIMSIYLPFGIALFQANMVQLLSISTQQRKLLDSERASIRNRKQGRGGVNGLWMRWKNLSTLHKTYVGIGTGMLLQVVITATIYGTSSKLQGHWGSIAKPQGQALCRKGPEWIPSALWQLFWCCIYGPYLLYKIRNVHDTHYWRKQTILCVVSGFPGAPLWLASVFTPGTAWKWVNRYYVPPMWLGPGIFAMQACTIFFPIYEAYHQHRLDKSTAQILQTWEDNKNWEHTTLGSGSQSSLTKSHAHKKSYSNTRSSTVQDSNYRSNYTLAALEKVLVQNPGPLLHFAATSDFSAENILFLLAVQELKVKWARVRSSPIPEPKPEVKRRLWNEAVEIYAFGVSERWAEFPINIEWKLRRVLDEMFGEAVERYMRERDVEREEEDAGHDILLKEQSTEKNISPATLSRETSSGSLSAPTSPTFATQNHDSIDLGTKYSSDDKIELSPTSYDEQITVPKEFNEHIFDAAEKSIKYLVVTNTWRKFVTAMREGDSSVSVEREAP